MRFTTIRKKYFFTLNSHKNLLSLMLLESSIDDSRSIIDDSRSIIDDSRSIIDDSRSISDYSRA